MSTDQTTRSSGTAQPGSEWVSRQVAAMAAAWDRGERITADEMLAQHPGLDTEAAVRLIFEEACLRRESGLDVDTAEVVRKYPQWGDALHALFDCDRLLRPSGPLAAYPEVLETLGPFLLLEELGQGASGRTYLATDPTLADRAVVVKVIAGDQDEHLALAQLRHTHIVPLFSEHSFPEQGLRALCMPYLGGLSLAEILKHLAAVPLAQRTGKLLIEINDRNTRATPTLPAADGPFRHSLEEASYVSAVLWICACVADALHYTHERGLVHMDIKPSNVLITVDGQPMLLDFHLAHVPIKAGEWVSDRIGGTPGWMSPEQESAMRAVSAGRAVPDAVDGRTDIFALGLLLRDALTTPSPRSGEKEPTSLRWRSGMSVALADIVQKCIAPNPRDRYGNAAALADDLRRQLNDLPLRGVRNRSLFELWRKWRKRHPSILAWGIAGPAVLLAAIALAAAVGAYRHRVAQLQVALEDGKRYRAVGNFDEAIHTLKRGLDGVNALPAVGELKVALETELLLAERGRMAKELHETADLIRFRYGIDLPSRDDARSLVQLCQTLWAHRNQLIPADGLTLDAHSSDRIKTDLLEVAAVWADLIVRLAPADDTENAQREALKLVTEADSLFGPSLILDGRRRQLAADLGEPTVAVPSSHQPQSAWEHYDLGRYELRSGRIQEADTQFRRTLELRPQDFWPNFYQGLCAFRLRQFDEAVAAFRTCIALLPQSAICHYNRALAYDALSRVDEAYHDYTAAIELEPGLTAALLNRGILSYKCGRHREAIADFERALRARTDQETQARLHFNLALAQRALGDRAAARMSADKAAELGSQDAKALQSDLR